MTVEVELNMDISPHSHTFIARQIQITYEAITTTYCKSTNTVRLLSPDDHVTLMPASSPDAETINT